VISSSTEFLDRLESQLKIGKEPASRRAIERILDVIILRRAMRTANIKASSGPNETSDSWLNAKKMASNSLAAAAAYPKDPADRIIGATALVEGLSLLTADREIRRSNALRTIW